MDIFERIESHAPKFSKGQRRIAAFITESPDKAAFMTAAKLGSTVGVSESTVVRFAYELGFDGYPDLSKAIRQVIKNQLTSVQRIAVTKERISSEEDVLNKILSSDADKIKHTLEEISREDFFGAAEALSDAKNIYIIGGRSSSALAQFIYFYLNLMFSNVHLIHTSSTSELYEQMVRVGPGDVLIGICFPRYTSVTVKAFRFAHNVGARTIAVTDGPSSPLAEYATYLLSARSDVNSFVDSLVAPLSVLNALIVAVGLKKQEQVTATFNRLEDIWAEYQVFQNTEKDGNDHDRSV